MFVLKTIIDKYTKNKKQLYSCFVDFRKAFDTVIHDAIYLKMLNCGMGGLFYKLLKNMYSKSMLAVKVGSELTESFPSNIGVRQGDVLSPNLFKIFINDLPAYLDHSMDEISLNNRRIDCLLYADDVVLLSTSATGLQNKLDLLETFCDEWCIDVNTSKTKVMVFNKPGRLIHTQLTFRGNKIESVRRYKYLGILFSLSGSFSEAKSDLYNKANKALFKLKADLFSLRPGIKSSLHIYNHTIKAVLNYSSELWGCYLPKSFKCDTLCDFSKIASLFPSEKMEIHFLKYILGVNKKASNFAIMSEVGKYPIIFDSFKSVLNYWHRLENMPTNLLKDAYTELKLLHHTGIDTWYGSLLGMLKVLDIPVEGGSAAFNKHFIKHSLSEHLHNLFRNTWYRSRENLIREDGKLRTYLKIKTNFGYEKYLDILNDFFNRKSLTRFRISNHKLKIELGRYTKPYTPLDQRICEKCDLNKIDDETHFFSDCSNFVKSRQDLFNKIKQCNDNFDNLSSFNKLYWCCTCEDPNIVRQLGLFLQECDVT